MSLYTLDFSYIKPERLLPRYKRYCEQGWPTGTWSKQPGVLDEEICVFEIILKEDISEKLRSAILIAAFNEKLKKIEKDSNMRLRRSRL